MVGKEEEKSGAEVSLIGPMVVLSSFTVPLLNSNGDAPNGVACGGPSAFTVHVFRESDPDEETAAKGEEGEADESMTKMREVSEHDPVVMEMNGCDGGTEATLTVQLCPAVLWVIVGVFASIFHCDSFSVALTYLMA